MKLCRLYESVAEILRGLDFGSLFSEFHPYRFALYTDTAVCLDGKLMPYDERFLGNTALDYDGEYIAIWNVEASPVEDPELLASSLVHEMFHCHQYTRGETRFPSDLKLLRYPEDAENYGRKFAENRCLADAYEYADEPALRRFAAIRNQRLASYPDMVREELKAETLEGVAEYIGLKSLANISPEKFREKLSGYLAVLRAEDKLQLDIRRISYYTGAVFCLCLERLGYTVRNDIGEDLTVYEQNPIPAAELIKLEPSPFFVRLCAEVTAEKERTIAQHMDTVPFTSCDGEICGYDPMNMFRAGNRIYCSHFVFLKHGGKMEMLSRAAVLVLKDDSDREITGYYS